MILLIRAKFQIVTSHLRTFKKKKREGKFTQKLCQKLRSV